MKKTFKKILATTLAGMFALTATIGLNAPKEAKAAEEEYQLFIAFGGDAAEENDWALNWAGGDAADGITATTATIKAGETATVSLEFDNPVVNTWYVAPTMIAENVVNADFSVKVLIDGQEVACDLTAGDNWWYEATGDYTDKQAVRIAGGFNEWGTQYIEEPANFTKIEFEITANSIEIGEGSTANLVDSTEEYDAFVAFGGDAAEENDWALNWAGGDAAEGITATTAKIKAGDTVTIGLEFANPVFNTWYVAPVLVGENIGEADFSVKVLIDGQEVACDLTAGDNWWYEATGNYSDKEAVRIAGGFNEWGAQYIEEPANFTKIEFEITANSIKVATAEEEPETPQSSAGPVDLDGTYHAYLGIQTPNWSFRNAFDEENYGRHNEEFFNRVTAWDADQNAYALPGEITDVEIAGNGTYTVSIKGIKFPEGEFANQEYFNLIFVSTDIPNTNEITISDMVLLINGRTVDINPIISPDSIDYLNMTIQNTWNADVAEIGYYDVSAETMDIEVTFTVSGFNYDNAGATSGDSSSDDASATDSDKKDDKKDGVNPIIIVVIVVVVVLVAVVAVVLGKKKKN